MRATVLNCTLKPSPGTSNTEALARVVMDALSERDVEVELVRIVDHDVKPGVSSDEGDGDEWPGIRDRILASEILVIAAPTWLGHPSSVAQRVLERLDALISETDDEGRPLAYNRVAGVVVTGNEDGPAPPTRSHFTGVDSRLRTPVVSARSSAGMPVDPDLALRQAAITRAQELSAAHDDLVPLAALRAGFAFRGQRISFGSFYKGIHRPRRWRAQRHSR